MIEDGGFMFNMPHSKVMRLTDADCTLFFQKNYSASTVVRMKEYTQIVAHACAVAGVMQLGMQQINIAGRAVYYTQCPFCKKLWYYVPQIL